MRIKGMKNTRGFTLIELMVTIAVLGLSLAFGVPAFQNSLANSALRSSTMEMITALNVARAEAVNQRKLIALKAVNGDWNDGWMVDYSADGTGDWDADDATQTEPLQRFNKRGTVTLAEANGVTLVEFRSTGLMTDDAGSAETLSITICDDRDNEIGRTIVVNQFGKLQNQVHADTSVCNP